MGVQGAKAKKQRILRRFSRHLSQFYPKLVDTYLCPTCLIHIPIDCVSEISKAHIIPQAAGGGITTWLCGKCNSAFGAKQDKWFGEYLSAQRGEHWPFDAKTKSSHFNLNGVRYGGTYGVSPTGSLDFVVHNDRSSPDALRQLDHMPNKLGADALEVSIPIPLLANQELINPGFLTAAYLLWFRELGYSWALQDHLSEVRKQVQNPGEEILHYRYMYSVRGQPFAEPWAGFMRADSEIYLAAGIADRIVVLPAADRPPVESPNLINATDISYRWHSFFNREEYMGPMGIAFQDRILVMPDSMLNPSAKGFVAFFPDWESDPVAMTPISDEEHEVLSREGAITRVRAKHRPRVPERNTGECSRIEE